MDGTPLPFQLCISCADIGIDQTRSIIRNVKVRICCKYLIKLFLIFNRDLFAKSENTWSNLIQPLLTLKNSDILCLLESEREARRLR